jgi:hypothetical protein
MGNKICDFGKKCHFKKKGKISKNIDWKLGGDQKYSLSGDRKVHGKIPDE